MRRALRAGAQVLAHALAELRAVQRHTRALAAQLRDTVNGLMAWDVASALLDRKGHFALVDKLNSVHAHLSWRWSLRTPAFVIDDSSLVIVVPMAGRQPRREVTPTERFLTLHKHLRPMQLTRGSSFASSPPSRTPLPTRNTPLATSPLAPPPQPTSPHARPRSAVGPAEEKARAHARSLAQWPRSSAAKQLASTGARNVPETQQLLPQLQQPHVLVERVVLARAAHQRHAAGARVPHDALPAVDAATGAVSGVLGLLEASASSLSVRARVAVSGSERLPRVNGADGADGADRPSCIASLERGPPSPARSTQPHGSPSERAPPSARERELVHGGTAGARGRTPHADGGAHPESPECAPGAPGMHTRSSRSAHPESPELAGATPSERSLAGSQTPSPPRQPTFSGLLVSHPASGGADRPERHCRQIDVSQRREQLAEAFAAAGRPGTAVGSDDDARLLSGMVDSAIGMAMQARSRAGATGANAAQSQTATAQGAQAHGRTAATGADWDGDETTRAVVDAGALRVRGRQAAVIPSESRRGSTGTARQAERGHPDSP